VVRKTSVSENSKAAAFTTEGSAQTFTLGEISLLSSSPAARATRYEGTGRVATTLRYEYHRRKYLLLAVVRSSMQYTFTEVTFLKIHAKDVSVDKSLPLRSFDSCRIWSLHRRSVLARKEGASMDGFTLHNIYPSLMM
jgi:hypothetical protein